MPGGIWISGAEVEIDTYVQLAREGVDWMANRTGAVLLLAAALPSLFHLTASRLLGSFAFAVFVAAVAMVVLGVGNSWRPSP